MLLLLLSCFSRVRLFVTPWAVAYQAPPSMEFSRQEYWSGLLFPSEIKLIIFFAAKDGEALYSQQKQYQELTVAQITNSLLQNSDLK